MDEICERFNGLLELLLDELVPVGQTLVPVADESTTANSRVVEEGAACGEAAAGEEADALTATGEASAAGETAAGATAAGEAVAGEAAAAETAAVVRQEGLLVGAAVLPVLTILSRLQRGGQQSGSYIQAGFTFLT